MKILSKTQTKEIREVLFRKLGLNEAPYRKFGKHILCEWLSNFFKKVYEEEIKLYSKQASFPEFKGGKYTGKYLSGKGTIKDFLDKISMFLQQCGIRKVIAFALPEEQHAQFKKNFKNKYNECAVEISPADMSKIGSDLLQVYFFPSDLSLIITVDHEGIVMMDASKSIIKNFKKFFPDWKKFSRLY